MAATSKELVRSLFAGKPAGRPPFIPYMAAAAARFMQVPVPKLLSDPTTLANSLQACRKLFKYDGIAVLLDTTLEAEACGCRIEWQEKEPPKVISHVSDGKDPDSLDISLIERRGRIPVVLEAARRLTQTVGREVAMLGVITGPVTLGTHLMGDDFLHALGEDAPTSRKVVHLSERIALALARAYGELKFDAIVLADSDLASLNPACYPVIQPMLKTLRNLVNFYDAPLIILTGRVPPVPAEGLSAFMELEADGFSLGNHISELESLPLSGSKMLGASLSTSALLGPLDDIEKATFELIDNRIANPFFVTSEWEVPPETPAENLHKVMQVLTSDPTRGPRSRTRN